MLSQQEDFHTFFDKWIYDAFTKYSYGSEFLTRHQLKLAITSLTGKIPPIPKEKSKFSYNEMRSFVGFININSIFSDLNLIYDQIDVKKKGYITPEDILQANSLCGNNLKKETLIQAFSRADTDSDGRILYTDFIEIVKEGLISLETI